MSMDEHEVPVADVAAPAADDEPQPPPSPVASDAPAEEAPAEPAAAAVPMPVAEPEPEPPAAPEPAAAPAAEEPAPEPEAAPAAPAAEDPAPEPEPQQAEPQAEPEAAQQLQDVEFKLEEGELPEPAAGGGELEDAWDTDAEAAALEALEARVTEATEGLATASAMLAKPRLLRYVRGYGLDVEKAAEAFLATIQWRMANDLDDIHMAIATAVEDAAEPSEATVASFPGFDSISRRLPVRYTHKTDKHGDPVTIEATGLIDTKALVNDASAAEFLVFHTYVMEMRLQQLDALSERDDRLARTVVIKDLKGLGVSHAYRPALQYLRQVVQMSQSHYPESVAAVYLVNAPWIFHTIWRVIRKWLAPRLLQKIHILGSNDVAAALLERIPAENLPVSLGGTCQCGGAEHPCVPATGLLAQDYDLAKRDAGMQEIELARRQVHSSTFVVPPGRMLAWSFRVKAHDIGFTPRLRKQGDGGAVEEDLQESKRCAAGELFYGTYTNDDADAQTVVLTFDNSYSRLRGKSLVFTAEIADVGVSSGSGDVSGEGEGSAGEGEGEGEEQKAE